MAGRCGSWKGIKFAAGIDPVTHLQFIDDAYLIGEASVQEANIIRSTLDNYSMVLGQFIN